ncbi:MAG TPA: ATP-binding protein [Candidatus Binatia bacterium]|nr:ATP-binding protein [Candidatus Binatia bacterium]
MIEQKNEGKKFWRPKEQKQSSIAQRILRAQAQLLQLTNEAVLINAFHTAQIVFWNRRASELYGWSPKEAKGRVVHDVLQTKFSEPLREIETKLLRKGQWDGELVHRRKDGKPIVVQSRWVLQRDFSGKPSDVLQLNQDITVKKQSAQTIGEKQRALLGTMAGVLAHEVANPLTGILSSLELAQRQIKKQHVVDSVLVSTIQGATQELHRLSSLLKDFRGVARPQMLDVKKTDLVKNIREALACELLSYPALGISVQFQFDDSLFLIADTDKIKQVILNLCKNAVEAMPAGGCLTLKGYHSAQMVVLEIGDTGMGIPEGVDVFELFKTTKPAGSGLGLSVVQQIVLAHNGTIAYTTQPGHGTTFKVCLPAAELPHKTE